MMTKIMLGLVITIALVGGLARGYEQADERQGQITAQMGEVLPSGAYRQLFIYSNEVLSQLEYRIGAVVNWSNLETRTSPSPDYRVYGSSSYLPAESGQEFTVRGTRSNNTRFILRLTLRVSEGAATISVADVTASSTPEDLQAPLVIQPQSAPTHMLPSVTTGGLATTGGNDPQSMAQRRANRMAQLNHRGHLDGGAVSTSMGTLYEGVGWHSAQGVLPETCVSVDGSAPLADAHAVGPGGTFRVRLYRVGTTPSGGNYGSRTSQPVTRYRR